MGQRAGILYCCGLVMTAAALLLTSVPASAAAAPPYGAWRSRTSTAQLYYYRNGSCSFIGYNPVYGRCRWNPSSNGGILTLFYPMPLEPGKIYFSVVWVNRKTIAIFGERFYAQ